MVGTVHVVVVVVVVDSISVADKALTVIASFGFIA